MTNVRTKKKTIADNMTQDEAEQHLSIYAQAFSRKKELEGQLEQDLTKIREQYQQQLNDLSETLDAQYDVLHAYGIQNRHLFADKKTLDLLHGKVGFRTGTPKVEKPKGITWDALAGLLKDKGYNDYLRIKEELNKDKIIEERGEETVLRLCSEFKINIVQDETFFVIAKEETKKG